MTTAHHDKPFRILLVDDNESFLTTMEGFLSGDPDILIVGKATSGEEALKLAAQEMPHLVLMDISMPGINGLLAAKKIKAFPHAPPIIILTFYDNPEYRVAANKIPVDGYLLKTHLGTDLLPLIEKFKLQTTVRINSHLQSEVGDDHCRCDFSRTNKETPMHTILIVDDSSTMRRMVKASLSTIPGAVLMEAENGLEAIEKVAIEGISLMVLDLNMPDMHGLEVLEFLRSHSKYRDLPVIVLTTRGDEASRKAALSAGASLYLTKPFNPGELKQHALELLGGTS